MDSSIMVGCVACKEPLTLSLESEDGDQDDNMGGSTSTSYVDDDVHLTCGCHFHWQCLLDAYSMTECPHCGRTLTSTTFTGEQQLLCNLKNEGGVQNDLDILPLLLEESFLKAYPEERKCRAFLEFCAEGDVEAIVNLLNVDDDSDNPEEEMSDTVTAKPVDVLRYQDQLGSMSTGLHVAIQNQKIEVAWLLLLLASCLEISNFPAEVIQAAEQIGVEREDQSGKVDIRGLRDGEGMTAEQRASTIGGMWNGWVASGRLKAPA